MREKIPQIVINAVDNGWIVHAGCLQLAFTDTNELGIELLKFLAQPEKVVDEYTERYGRAANPLKFLGYKFSEAVMGQRSAYPQTPPEPTDEESSAERQHPIKRPY